MINVTVKAKNGAIVYDIDGERIPEDRFSAVPLSPGIIRALKDGDLEEVASGAAPQPGVYRRRHRQIAA